jgi:hypothetical protein
MRLPCDHCLQALVVDDQVPSATPANCAAWQQFERTRHGSCSETVVENPRFRMRLLCNNNVTMRHSQIALRRIRV